MSLVRTRDNKVPKNKNKGRRTSEIDDDDEVRWFIVSINRDKYQTSPHHTEPATDVKCLG